jgi:hypothetical protein
VATFAFAQLRTVSLPPKWYNFLSDSTTQADIVYHSPATNSLSIEGRNVRMFNTFLENRTAADTLPKADGFIMWLINGREFLTGYFFLGNQESYVRFKKDTIVFVNKLTEQGANFLKQQKR